MKPFVQVQTEDFDISRESEQLRIQSTNVGAIVTFTGLVREFHEQDNPQDKVQELFLEHYPGMTEKCLLEIAEEAMQRWAISGCRVIHRVGALKPGDQIVFVATSGAHRQAAFEAAEFIMDYLKTRAPFWKRQTDEKGSEWVEHRETDEQAAQRWKS